MIPPGKRCALSRRGILSPLFYFVDAAGMSLTMLSLSRCEVFRVLFVSPRFKVGVFSFWKVFKELFMQISVLPFSECRPAAAAFNYFSPYSS